MDKSKHRHHRHEVLGRWGHVISWHARLSVHADRPRGYPPERQASASLELKGKFNEAVRDVVRFSVLIFQTDKPGLGNAPVPCVGAFTSVKPDLQGAVYVTEREYQQLLTLAASNRLAWCYVAFTEPYRRSAHIVSIEFSTGAPDDETQSDQETNSPLTVS